MKLLLVSDTSSLHSILTPRGDDFQLNSVLIDYLCLSENDDLKKLKSVLSHTRYHLVLVVVNGKFQSEFVRDSSLINVVNNYISESELQNADFFDSAYKESHLPSIVNKTNSYFNVFLDITKAVSYTTANGDVEIELRRLDTIHSTNYFFAYLFQKFNCAYYILNYQNELNLDEIKSLLEKLD